MMINQRFLVPVLALAGFGLPVGASMVDYCNGASCGTNNQAAFNNAVTTANYAYEGLLIFSVANGVFSGNSYTDNLTGVVFTDTTGGTFSAPGGVLTTSGQKDNVLITMPSTVLAIALTVDVAGGLCFDAYCSTPGAYTGFAGSINPSGAWSINIGPLAQNNGFTKIDNFNAAMAGTGGSETPEVGTLLLIGSGLIAMRWMRRLPRRRRVFQVPQTA